MPRALDRFSRRACEGFRMWQTSSSAVLRRRMVPASSRSSSAFPPGATAFTVMTWNVLFGNYASNHEQYCDRYDLDTACRIGMVVAAILEYKPTILALQECESDDGAYGAWRMLRAALEECGYAVAHQPKHLRSPQHVPDAVALAYRRDSVSLARPGNEPFGFQLLPAESGAQVAIVGAFTLTGGQLPFVVATTHLSANKLAEDTRLRQMPALLDKIKDQVLPALGSAAADVPVIVLGDFNTEPRWELIPSLEAASPVGPLRDAYANNCTATATATSGHHPPGYTDTPFTSYSWFLQGVADYVLHTDGLVAVKVLKVPGTREVRALYAADYPPQRGGGPRFEMLPTRSFPSDHVPLMVEFAFAAAPADIGVHTPPAGPAAASLPPPPPPVVWSCGARSPAMTTSSQPTATHETTTHAAASSVVQDHHHHDQPRSVAVGGASGRVPTMHDDDDASPPPPPPAVGAFPAAAKAQTAASVATSSPPPGDRETREQSHHHHADEDAVRSIATAEVAPLCSHRTTTASEAPTPPALPASTLDEQGVSSRGPAHGGGDGAATVRNASANAVAPDDDDADHDGVVVRGDCGPHDDNARAGHHHHHHHDHHHDATRDVEPCAAADSDDDGAAHAADAANDGADSASASSSSDCEIVGEL